MTQFNFSRRLLPLIALLLTLSLPLWAENLEYSFTIQPSDFTTASYADNNKSHDFTATCKTDGSKTMTVACTSNQVYQNSSVMQWQKNNGYIYNTTDLSTIKSVTVNSSAGSFTTFYGTTEHPTSGTTVGNGYFTVKVGNATGKTSSIVVVFEVTSGGSTPTVAAPTFSVEEGAYYVAQNVSLATETEGANIYYTLDGSTPTASSTLYTGSIAISSTTTIKAIAVKSGESSSVASATYSIYRSIVNTQETAYTVEEARALIDASDVNLAEGQVYVKGTISEIVTAWSDQYNNITYNISADGATAGQQFQLFRCTTNGAEVGDIVIAYGTLKKYNSTYEFDSNNTIVDIQKPAAKNITALAVSGTPTKTTYNVGDAFDPAGLTVTATYSDASQEVISTGFNWTIDYGTDNTALVAGATSVDVKVSADEVMSEVYTVNGLTVTVPVTLTSIAVSGTPTKTNYYAGDAFDPAGLVVTGTYSDSHQETITEDIDWAADPATLALGTTSVNVTATVGSVASESYTVNGLTVTKPDFETVTYNFSSFTSGQTVELTDLDGFVITLAKGTGTSNPTWVSSQARVYAKGSLTVKANNAIIKSIEYTYVVNANKNGATPTIDGVEGTTTAGTWDAENKTWTGADEEVTFSTSGEAGNIGFTKLVIKYTEGSKIETSLEWSASDATVTIGADDNTFPTLTTTPFDLSGVTYESSNTAVATIADDGTITLVKAGETTITASYEGDLEHASATSVSYTLTVNKAPFVPTPAPNGYETVDFTAIEPYKSLGTNGTKEMATYEGTSFSAEFAKKQGTNNAPKYYQNGNAVRCYVDNTITIIGAENILSVDITWTVEDDAVSITGLGTTTAVVTFSKTCRFTKIVVNYNKYTRSVTSGNYGTICLPFAVNAAAIANSNATFYSIAGVTKSGENITGIVIEEKEALVAGTPYIFKANAEEITCAYSGEPVNEPVAATGLIGTFTSGTLNLVSGQYYIGSTDNTLHKWGGADYAMEANKAVIDLSEVDEYVPSAAPVRIIAMADESQVATGLDELNTATIQKFFQNGQVYILREGRLYDVTGRLVK